MKRTVPILALFLAFAGHAIASGNSNLASVLKFPSAKSNSLPESLVRSASLVVQPRDFRQPWDKVRNELVAQGLSVPPGRDSQYTTMYDVPVATNVLEVERISFDLVLEYEIDKRTKDVVPTARHNHVLTATASLRGEVNRPTAELIAAGIFPTNSILERALSSPERQRWDGGHPVLKKIEMSYDLIRHHRESEWPYGYHLSLYFGDDVAGRWKKRIFLTVVSSEDLPRDRENSEVKNWQGWMSTSLNDIQCWGTNGE